MKKKYLLYAAVIFSLYFTLISVLLYAETGYDGGISSVGEAVWYSIVTMTTVGYGDMVPHSPVGKLIGGIFLLLSLGLLTAIVSFVVVLMKGNFWPEVQLMLRQKKHWYVFPMVTSESIALANHFSKETVVFLCKPEQAPGNVCGIFIDSDPFSLSAMAKGGITFFVFGEDSLKNIQMSSQLAEYGKVYCGTELVQNSFGKNIDYMNPSSACARMYWKECPLRPEEKHIVLIGGKRWMPQLLNQALLVNVLDTHPAIRYHIYGDKGAFLADHPYIDDCFGIQEDIPDRDSLYFYNETLQADVLLNADRIIICLDSDRENIAMLSRIRSFFPTKASLYLHLDQPVDGLQVVQFGTLSSLYTPENVLHHQLDAVAIVQNERYNQRNLQRAVPWEKLSDYSRGANLAAADHQAVKVRLLLNDFFITEPSSEQRRRAAEAYRLQICEKQAYFRELEHLRWERYLYLNNWRYGERDNCLRIHNLLCSFDKLTEEEKALDDDAWLSIDDE